MQVKQVSTLIHFSLPLNGATSFPDRGLYKYDQTRVSLCLLCLVVTVY